jgi:hypothetical protein
MEPAVTDPVTVAPGALEPMPASPEVPDPGVRVRLPPIVTFWKRVGPNQPMPTSAAVPYVIRLYVKLSPVKLVGMLLLPPVM